MAASTMKISLVVYQFQNKYYSTRYIGSTVPGMLRNPGVRELFTFSGSDLDELEQQAKKEARKRNLEWVANLDH